MLIKNNSFIFNKRLLFKYSINILIFNYTHIGFKKNLTVHSFRKAILGFYSNVTIINPFLTLANLKMALNFIFKLILKNQKICFIFFDFSKSFQKRLFFKNQYFFFDYWISGFLTNHKFTKNYNFSKKWFCPHIPASLVCFGMDPQKLYDIANEAKRLLLPCFSFVDSNTNPSFFSYWIPINSKSGFTKLFFINFINSILQKVNIYKKFFFLKKIKRIKKKKNWLLTMTFNEWIINKKKLFNKRKKKLFNKKKKLFNKKKLKIKK